MATFTVTNAGTVNVRGDYIENDTNDGKPAYEIVGGGFWLYWSNTLAGGTWAIAVILGESSDPMYLDLNFVGGATPTIGNYSNAVGAPPSATVSAVVASGNHLRRLLISG